MTETKIAGLKSYTERQFLVVFAILLVTILADAIIGMDADIFVDFTTSLVGISIFVLFASIYIFGQWYMFRKLNEKTKLGRGRAQFHSISIYCYDSPISSHRDNDNCRFTSCFEFSVLLAPY